MDALDKNFGLDQHAFVVMVESLKKGDDNDMMASIFTESKNLINKIIHRYKASYDDAYDAFLDTLLVFRQRLVQDKIYYGNTRGLFEQIMYQQYLRNIKSSADINSIDGYPDLEVIDNENQYDDSQIFKLEKSLKKLSEKCRELFVLNYYQGLNLIEIAKLLDLNYDNARKQKERCKQSLIKLYNDEK